MSGKGCISLPPENTRARGRRRENVIKRFLRYVSKLPAGCWLWEGSARDGFARLWDGRNSVHAARFAYELMVGSIADGLVIQWSCDNRLCVNPEHLTIHKPNPGRAAQQRAKTHCPQGHPYDEQNTYFYRNAHGNTARNCRACMSAREEAKKEKN